MRILIVGGGGREHALLWKLRRDAPRGTEFFATDPNGGMATSAVAAPVPAGDSVALCGWARGHRIDLAVIGPEGPLAAGLADKLRKAGVPAFGPSAGAARIESSKAFAKELMLEAGVPTAACRVFTDSAAAERHVRERGAPLVVKASGLAGGKGAVVCATEREALEAVRAMLAERRMGEAGGTILVEEYMEGEELSIFALTDGESCLLLPPSQDHKRVGEGDVGPNTGGMGAYAPVSIATDTVLAQARERILRPVLGALAERGSPFKGLLYAGLMLTSDGLKVVEFNCRFGDPETQAVLPLMAGSLLDPVMEVAEGGGIREGAAPSRSGACVATVVVVAGYPGPVATGREIVIDPGADGDEAIFFHAGTRLADGKLTTSGGRVLAATATARSLPQAAEASARAAGRVRFPGAFFRSDIGWRERGR